MALIAMLFIACKEDELFKSGEEVTFVNGHCAVDLGLSVKWATCNIGASSPEDNGNYYAWGKTTTKIIYNSNNTPTDYNGNDITGNYEYDAAVANWGDGWRMPTYNEFNELIVNCYWEKSYSSVNGYKITSKINGNSIFMPAAGWRDAFMIFDVGSKFCYWSSIAYEEDNTNAYYLGVDDEGIRMKNINCGYGHSIRPVLDINYDGGHETDEEESVSGEENGFNYVDLGLPSGLKWATCNVGSNTSTEYGNYYAWGETTIKSDYSSSNSVTNGINLGDISGNPQYDAATANWGGNWRMPTDEEQKELLNRCNWIWTVKNGVNGYKVISKTNGNSIFLPAAGERLRSTLDYAGSKGCYWTSTPNETYTNSAYHLEMDLNNQNVSSNDHRASRWYGRSVRPVTE